MDTRVLKIIGVVAVLLLLLGIGTAAAGMVYREAQDARPAFALSKDSSEVEPEPGLIVTSVDADGPASEAGVVRGDILLNIDDHVVETLGDVQRVLRDLEVGDQVVLTILHGDELRTFSVTLGERNGRSYLGVSLCCGWHEPWAGENLPIRTQKPLIVEVIPDSPAEEAGLREGDLILAVDDEELDLESDLAEVIGAYRPGDKVNLELWSPRAEGKREVTVRLGEHPENPGHAYLGVRYVPGFQLRIYADQHLPQYKFHFNFPHFSRNRFGRPEFDENDFDFFDLPFGGDRFFHFPLGEVERGLLIQEVVEGSPAEKAGLREGYMITTLEGEPVEGVQAFVEAIASHQPGEIVRLMIFHPDEVSEIEFEVELGEHPDKKGAGYLGLKIGAFFHIDSFEKGDEPWRFGPLFDFKEWLDLFPFDSDFHPPGLNDI